MLAIGWLSIVATASVTFADAVHGQWDIVAVHGDSLVPGGVAFAMANDGTLITFTGTGTFVLSNGRGTPQAVTGGGTWETRGLVGQNAAHGTYAVTDLVLFEPGPALPPGTPLPLHDLVGNPDEASAGLLVLRIAYSDGSEGTLVVSCRLEGVQDGVFADDTAMIFEGVTATKGSAGFWRNFRIRDSNRTLFHLRSQARR